jgi:hypothetical protein
MGAAAISSRRLSVRYRNVIPNTEHREQHTAGDDQSNSLQQNKLRLRVRGMGLPL